MIAAGRAPSEIERYTEALGKLALSITHQNTQRIVRSRPGKPNQRKGQNEKKFTKFATIFVNSGVFPWENKHDSHLKLLFRNAPAKSS